MKESPSFIQLYQRIRRKDTTEYCKSLLLYIILSCLFGLICTSLFYALNYHNYIFNSWFGSFDFNLAELMTYRHCAMHILLLSNENYVQVELNETYYHEDLFYKYYLISSHQTDGIFTRFPNSHQSYNEKCLSYRFDLFQRNTLDCIVQQTEIDSTHLITFKFITQIENFYRLNTEEFNLKVPMITDDTYLKYIIADLICIFLWMLLLNGIVRTFKLISYIFTSNISSSIQKKLNLMNIKSLKYLDLFD